MHEEHAEILVVDDDGAYARTLTKRLQVKVCPACLTTLRDAPHVADGHCTLCSSEVTAPVAQTTGASTSANGTAPSAEGLETEAKFDVSSELRATKARWPRSPRSSRSSNQTSVACASRPRRPTTTRPVSRARWTPPPMTR